MQAKNSQVESQAVAQSTVFVAAEVANPLADRAGDRQLVMRWVATGKDYPKMEARWIYDDARGSNA
ncbi:MAG: hypothetical protein ACFB9N_00745 [Geitlerinemataceae cyanobacterium]